MRWTHIVYTKIFKVDDGPAGICSGLLGRLNPGPPGYQPGAPTRLSYGPY